MRSKTFARTKEQIATTGLPCAVGSAQNAKVYQMPEDPKLAKTWKQRGGQDLLAKDAARIVALVSLGKRSILFRAGLDPTERAGAIDELAVMLKKGANRRPFAISVLRCVAAVAIDEIALDMCPTCLGARMIPMVLTRVLVHGRQPMTPCPICAGGGRRRYQEDERVVKLARVWFELAPSSKSVSGLTKEIRAHRRLHDLLDAINWARGLLIEAERVAVQETARMLERR